MGEHQKKTNEYYSQGNLAPQIDYLSDYFELEGFQPQVIEGTKKPVAIKVKKGYTVLLFLVIALFIAVCAVYLKSSFSLIAVQAEANRLKAELQSVRIQNAQIEHRIHETVDLEKTYEIAVNRLKMRQPEKHEIHYIKRKAGSYTLKLNQRSYSEKNNNLKQFIIFILKDW
ncbi:hypothetical protein EII17_01280 [Clostridiales bacterium COT073_COT-073]|nr:hypothetical protein EII17_01280 [Clostridiales bacterium COT073_COT-073]